MRILIIAADTRIGKSAYHHLQQQKTDITVLVNSKEKKEEYQQCGARAIVGNPTENSVWMNNIPQEIDYILNCYTPKLEGKTSIKNIENTHAVKMLHLAQNLVFIAKQKKIKRIFQPCNAFFYKHAGVGKISENTQYDNAPTNYGMLYAPAINYYTAQKDVKITFCIYGHYIYASDGTTFPQIPTVVGRVYMYCSPGDNNIQLIHEQDLGSAMAFCALKEIDESIINIADDQPLPQKKFMHILAKINNIKYVIPVKKELLKLVMGDAYANSITADITLKNNLMKAKGYWLQYPDYTAGFAKEYF